MQTTKWHTEMYTTRDTRRYRVITKSTDCRFFTFDCNTRRAQRQLGYLLF